MSQIDYANPSAAKPDLGQLAAPETGAEEAIRLRSSVAVLVPLVISLTVHWIFFIAYWIPETSTFPGHEWWLTQLSPMVSKGLTSAGQPQVPVQETQSGLGGLVLLGCSFALLWLSRTRYWLGRTAIIVPAALGLLVGLVTLGALVISSTFSDSALSIVLLGVWVATAGYAAYHGFFADTPERAPKTRRTGLPLLVAYALIGPAPTAVGRCLFAADLRDAAAGLQDNTVALRLAGLWTPSTALLYLAGLVVGATVWVAYQWWPPRRQLSFVGLSLTFAASVVLCLGLGWPISTVAQQRVTTLLYASPSGDVHFTCGSRILAPDPDGPVQEPTRTLVITGLTCRTATTFAGYRQLATRTLPASLSPVRATTPEGTPITGKIVVAEYDDVLVVGLSDRVGGQINQLTGLEVANPTERWTYRCPGRGPLTVRFAAVPGGDRPDLGHVTDDERAPRVVLRCGMTNLSFDPATGPPR